VVWVEGEAGAGKTAFLRRTLEGLPAGYQVARAQADELATDMPFEVVSQLGEAVTESPFATGMQLLNSWARLQERGPVVVVVEDLHWADTASRQSLLTQRSVSTRIGSL
jgi:hypothetical protein